MGMRASHTGDIILEDVRVPIENRLGEEGAGFFIAMRAFEHTRPLVAIAAVGLARAAYEYALEYAQQRVQFGKPIIAKQAIRFMLADMATEIDAARLLVWRGILDGGQGAALQRTSKYGEGLRCRYGHESDHGRRPDPGRLRLYAGVPGGEMDARCQDTPNRRRHQPDPEGDHLADAGDGNAMRMTLDFPVFNRSTPLVCKQRICVCSR